MLILMASGGNRCGNGPIRCSAPGRPRSAIREGSELTLRARSGRLGRGANRSLVAEDPAADSQGLKWRPWPDSSAQIVGEATGPMRGVAQRIHRDGCDSRMSGDDRWESNTKPLWCATRPGEWFRRVTFSSGIGWSPARTRSVTSVSSARCAERSIRGRSTMQLSV
jgi:hypothetical protein